MKEQWQIEFARKVCRQWKLQYKIEGEVLYLFVPQFGHYVRSCYSLLDFDSEDDISDMIKKEIFNWML